VSSLRALRLFASNSTATQPFLGIGDPLLDDHPARGGANPGRGTAARGGVRVAPLFRGGVGDVRAVAALPSLPETAGELAAMARAMGAGNESLVLRAAATETAIKAMPLASRRVLAFATHGAVAGDLSGLAEPALVLTPPAQASERDDGLLTASEIALLKLDADWVILSACNTAAGDGTPGAEGLSGLAKAFVYAGARTLLVSHWPVASEPTVAITTRMLAEAVKPGVGRDEAHRRAMLAYLADPANLALAHPAYWAAFAVIGEGNPGAR
jgi:CHAT domain-containing protein